MEDRKKSWIRTFLGGTHHHYSWQLPGRLGFVMAWLLRRLFSGIRIDPAYLRILRDLPPEAVVVYVTKYKSDFEYLFAHSRYRTESVPWPRIGFGFRILFLQPVLGLVRIAVAHADQLLRRFRFPDPVESGFLRSALEEQKSAFVSLVERRDFYRRFVKSDLDPLQYLVRFQKASDRPVFLVPQLMFFSRRPHRPMPSLIDILFGSEQRPGRLRRLAVLFRHPERVFVEISEPVRLDAFIDDPAHQGRSDGYMALVLRRNLLRQINRHRQSITGPSLKSDMELKQNILTRERLAAFMKKQAERRDLPLYRVHREALGYLDEIAAKYNPAFIKAGVVTAEWVFRNMFDGISVDRAGLERIKRMSLRGPLVLIPCHRSHIDSLVLSYILHTNDMPCPHIVAGKNLSFWPMGPLFRRFGAFFIRRSFSGAVFYAKVFAEYVHTLLQEGFNIGVFIEGTRSRTGKMLPPQLGLLSLLLNAFKDGACEDMIFAPVYIGYDRVPEENAYLHEIGGGDKAPESFGQFWRARRVLKRRYGRVYIHFSEPFSIRDLLADSGETVEEMGTKAINQVCRSLAGRILHQIDRVSVVTPQALIALTALNGAGKVFTRAQLMHRVEAALAYLQARRAPLAETLSIDPGYALDHVLNMYLRMRHVQRVSGPAGAEGEEARYRVADNRRAALDYYKNNCLSFFIPAAFTALTILEADAFQFSSERLHTGYRVLQELFENEFSMDPERPPAYQVRKTLKAFIDDAILVPHPTLPDTYTITSGGYRKLRMFAGFVRTLLVSYRIVLQYFRRYARGEHDAKQRMKKIRGLGMRFYRKGEIDLKEALSMVNYENGIAHFQKVGIRGSESGTAIQAELERINRWIDLSR